MKSSIIFLLFSVSITDAACTMTGAGDKSSVPVVASDTLASQPVATADTAAGKELTIAMAGDIMMGTTYPDTVLPPNDGKRLFSDVAKVLSEADVAAANLEGTLSDTASLAKEETKHTYAFRTPLRFAPRLGEAGFDFLSMANNHSFDFGISGVRSTEHALASLGIAYAGISSRKKCDVVERGGVRYGFCAFGHNGYTVRHQDLDGVKLLLDSISKISDIVIVSFHGGAEGSKYSHLPYGKEMFLGEDRGSLREFAHFCIDNGADVVYGHGPHVVRCVELYKNRFIAYSLGNFCTPYGINVSGISGYAPVISVRVGRDGGFIDGQIHSFIQKRGIGPRRDSTNVVARQIKNLTSADIKNGNLKISGSGQITPLQSKGKP